MFVPPLLRTQKAPSCRKETGQKGDSQITIFRRALAVIWTLQTPEKNHFVKKQPNFHFKRSCWEFFDKFTMRLASCTLISFLFEFLISRFADMVGPFARAKKEWHLVMNFSKGWDSWGFGSFCSKSSRFIPLWYQPISHWDKTQFFVH